MPRGELPVESVVSTVLVARSMTDTVPLPLFVTYALVEERATELGELPTGMVASTAFVARLMTETVLLCPFVT